VGLQGSLRLWRVTVWVLAADVMVITEAVLIRRAGWPATLRMVIAPAVPRVVRP
jgi:hypothetical protein